MGIFTAFLENYEEQGGHISMRFVRSKKGVADVFRMSAPDEQGTHPCPPMKDTTVHHPKCTRSLHEAVHCRTRAGTAVRLGCGGVMVLGVVERKWRGKKEGKGMEDVVRSDPGRFVSCTREDLRPK